MKQPCISTSKGMRVTALAALLLAAAAADATLVQPSIVDGTFADYGAIGNIFELKPQLSVQGLGSPGDPGSVVALNPLLQYKATPTGVGTTLMTITFDVRNISLTDSFFDLRFMVYINPDGAPSGAPLEFLDRLTETWGAAAAGDPLRREGRAFISPADTILSRFQLTRNLDEGPPAHSPGCLAAAGCDATVGLQWNAAQLGPGETFRVTFGLSDDGQHLSSRWVDATSVASPADTALRISGLSAIIAVPEPGAAWMLAGGLVLVGAALRRRQQH